MGHSGGLGPTGSLRPRQPTCPTRADLNQFPAPLSREALLLLRLRPVPGRSQRLPPGAGSPTTGCRAWRLLGLRPTRELAVLGKQPQSRQQTASAQTRFLSSRKGSHHPTRPTNSLTNSEPWRALGWMLPKSTTQGTDLRVRDRAGGGGGNGTRKIKLSGKAKGNAEREQKLTRNANAEAALKHRVG